MTDILDFRSRQLAALKERADYETHLDRLCRGIPTVAHCVEQLRSADLTNDEIAALLQQAAREIKGTG
jgi:hypothetical protein